MLSCSEYIERSLVHGVVLACAKREAPRVRARHLTKYRRKPNHNFTQVKTKPSRRSEMATLSADKLTQAISLFTLRTFAAFAFLTGL